jgi:hypothetical protein
MGALGGGAAQGRSRQDGCHPKSKREPTSSTETEPGHWGNHSGTPMQTGRDDWSRLTRLQIGRYAEYFVKTEFTLHGFEMYTSEVDTHGIDFVVRRRDGRY